MLGCVGGIGKWEEIRNDAKHIKKGLINRLIKVAWRIGVGCLTNWDPHLIKLFMNSTTSFYRLIRQLILTDVFFLVKLS